MDTNTNLKDVLQRFEQHLLGEGKSAQMAGQAGAVRPAVGGAGEGR